MSPNDKGDIEMIPGAVHRSSISLTTEEHPGKPQLGFPASSYLKMRSVGSHIRSEGEKEGNEKKVGYVLSQISINTVLLVKTPYLTPAVSKQSVYRQGS